MVIVRRSSVFGSVDLQWSVGSMMMWIQRSKQLGWQHLPAAHVQIKQGIICRVWRQDWVSRTCKSKTERGKIRKCERTCHCLPCGIKCLKNSWYKVGLKNQHLFFTVFSLHVNVFIFHDTFLQIIFSLKCGAIWPFVIELHCKSRLPSLFCPTLNVNELNPLCFLCKNMCKYWNPLEPSEIAAH